MIECSIEESVSSVV